MVSMDGKAYQSAGTNAGSALLNVGKADQAVSAVLTVADGTGLVVRSDATGQNVYLISIAAGAMYKR